MRRIILFLIIIFIVIITAVILYLAGFFKRNFTPLPQPQDLINLSEKAQTIDAERVAGVAHNLSIPWAIAFLLDNTILVTERGGEIKLIIGNKTQTIAQINVKQTGESGLHGITLDPKFESNKYIYIYYTTSSNGGNTFNRVARFKFENNSLVDEKILVDNIPGAQIHDGGRIKFGPDGYLYITTGDASEPSLAQNTESLAGKILRIDRDGNIPNDNPFKNAVYSYGHRNPQGIAWDDNGQLYEVEHGSSTMDEFNKIIKGGNYGWPTVRGDETRDGMVSPLLHSGSSTWAPAGLTYTNGKFYFGGLRGSALFEIENADSNPILTKTLDGEFGRIREVILGPDNLLYITTSNTDGRGIPASDDDKIIRVNPQKL